MFTGIITEIGVLRAARAPEAAGEGDWRFVIGCGADMARAELGASIACSGVCLTVVARGVEDEEKGWFSVDASAETLSKTNLGDWRAGSRVNLERALKVGDELGGHIVTGHVDGVGVLAARRAEGDSRRLEFEAPLALAPFIAPKGSIALDGASLTVNEVADNAQGARFGVNIIPHTQKLTTLGALEVGARVNLEIDPLARYLARLAQFENGHSGFGRG